MSNTIDVFDCCHDQTPGAGRYELWYLAGPGDAEALCSTGSIGAAFHEATVGWDATHVRLHLRLAGSPA